MVEEIEKFVRYSIRYQIVLAQHVANICNMNVYIFDCSDHFRSDNKVEMIDGVRTVFKNGKRAVLSIAVQESFADNYELFAKYIDQDVAQKDDVGLYVLNSPHKVHENDPAFG
jgi:hypothetical protein